MKRLNLKWTVLIVALAVGTTLVWAQQESSPSATAPATARYSMMRGSGHYGYMHATMARLQAAITKARESRDPAATKAALAEAQAELTKLEQVGQHWMNEGMGMMMGSRGMRGRMMGYSGQMMPMGGMGMMMGSRGMRGGMTGYSRGSTPMNGMYGHGSSQKQ